MSAPRETLALAADSLNRYPGELATFHLRFSVPDQPAGVTLQLAMPKVMQIESLELPEGVPGTLPSVAEVDQDLIVLIPLGEHFTPGQTCSVVARARLNTFYADQHLLTEASLVREDGSIDATETVRLAVYGKGKYLQYLPELYESDGFTSRFLMLFESFWKPISQQIDQMDAYFDADLTPPEFIPWLASWVGLPVDPSLPVERVRALLKQAILFFQCRGTVRALKTYLEIYTAGQVEITERRARNFVLGPAGTLGQDVALGSNNQPNTVQIAIRVPGDELERCGYSAAMYQQKMREIVRAMVPAQTIFEVSCAFDAQPA